MKLTSPAFPRNRDVILDGLGRLLPDKAHVLEVASGVGEHAVWLAARLPVAHWQPSDPREAERASIRAWTMDPAPHATADALAGRVAPPLDIDLTRDDWPAAASDAGPSGPPNAMLAVNVTHVSPFEATEGLFRGAALLAAGGPLRIVIYGPFDEEGRHTGPGNAAFHDRLVTENPDWGIRDVSRVVEAAGAHGFRLAERLVVPADNRILCFDL